MNPENTAANVALAISVVNISSITSVPMLAGRKPLSADRDRIRGQDRAVRDLRAGERRPEDRQPRQRGQRGLQRLERDPTDDRVRRDRPELVEELPDPVRDRDPELVEHEQHDRDSGKPGGIRASRARAGLESSLRAVAASTRTYRRPRSDSRNGRGRVLARRACHTTADLESRRSRPAAGARSRSSVPSTAGSATSVDAEGIRRRHASLTEPGTSVSPPGRRSRRRDDRQRGGRTERVKRGPHHGRVEDPVGGRPASLRSPERTRRRASSMASARWRERPDPAQPPGCVVVGLGGVPERRAGCGRAPEPGRSRSNERAGGRDRPIATARGRGRADCEHGSGDDDRGQEHRVQDDEKRLQRPRRDDRAKAAPPQRPKRQRGASGAGRRQQTARCGPGGVIGRSPDPDPRSQPTCDEDSRSTYPISEIDSRRGRR